MIILTISILISLILIYEMFKISNEIDKKNEIISYLKNEVIQYIKNNLELNDKKYIIFDLNNKLKKEIEHIQGSVGTYKTTYDPNKKTYKCTCMGFWRSKGNCKHVKALKEKNK